MIGNLLSATIWKFQIVRFVTIGGDVLHVFDR